MSLNPAQAAAVQTLSGPLLVLAGAGSGKTRVVTHRIAELIRRGTPAERILAVTFTKKAAGEMQERAAELLGKRLPQKPEISTFHSLCVRVLRRHARLLGYPEQFAIYDRGDQESAARAALRDIRVDGQQLRPGDLLHAIGRWKNSSIRPDKAAATAQTDKEHLAAMAYRRYQKSLKACGALDFDDLLLCTEELFALHPQARAAEANRFSHLLIDEYQDTNGSQYRIVKALAEGHRNLCVVGDDDQSIYGWRGAEVEHILRFKHDWPDATVVRLEANYRSTRQILELANTLIRFNKQRHDKVLRAARIDGERPRTLQYPDAESEAREVVEEIRQAIFHERARPRDFAILFRTNEQPRSFEQELRRAKLPYTLIGGMSFFDRKEVKDVLAYFKAIVQPRDEVSLLRIINTPPRGIGQKSVEALLAHAVQNGRPLYEVLGEARKLAGFTEETIQSIERFRGLLDVYRKRFQTESLVEVAADLLHKTGYRKELERIYKEPADRAARWAAVEETINGLGSYAQRAREPSLAGYLDDVLLSTRDDSDDKESKLARDAIVLMTLHAAKGLEFPQVYMVGMEEDLLPHHRTADAGVAAIEEERRLCYVGVTRARDRLTLTLSLTRNKWGKPRDSIPSRFLFEMLGMADSPQAAAARERAVAARRGGTARTPGQRPQTAATGAGRKPLAKPAARPVVKPGLKKPPPRSAQ